MYCVVLDVDGSFSLDGESVSGVVVALCVGYGYVLAVGVACVDVYSGVVCLGDVYVVYEDVGYCGVVFG